MKVRDDKMTMMINSIKEIYFIKKITFPGEINNIVELISVTKETTNQYENTAIVSPEILASYIKETNEPVSDSAFSDVKIHITKEQAERLTELVCNEELFLTSINELI